MEIRQDAESGKFNGEAATIKVGTVTSGELPQVENEGTLQDAIFNFVLPRGADGQNGQDGQDGVSPTVTTETISGGTRVTITDASGAHEFDVMNGQNGAPGADGQDGQNGQDGITPTIGENGNWFLGDTDTGKPSQGKQGEPGRDGVQIDDTAVSSAETWSSRKIIDTLCPEFSVIGNPVTCTPVEGYPLGAVVTLEPKQAGSGDPSPENVRPISGYDEVAVNMRGKNLVNVNNGNVVSTVPDGFLLQRGPYPIDKEYTYIGVSSNGYWNPTNISYYEISENGNVTIITTSIGYGIGFNVRCAPNTTYYIKNADSCYMQISFLDNEGFFISYTSDATNKSFNTPENCYNFIVVLCPDNNNETIYKEVQIELGSTPTPYEPYQPGTTATLTLPETIYGGSVDAVTGMGSDGALRLELAITDMDNGEDFPGWRNIPDLIKCVGENWNKPLNNDHFISCNICSNAHAIGINTNNPTNPLVFLSKDSFGLTQSQWKEQYPDLIVQIILKLATPEPFQATGWQMIPALSGENTLFTDGTTLKVTGKENPLITIEKLTERIIALEQNAIGGII